MRVGKLLQHVVCCGLLAWPVSSVSMPAAAEDDRVLASRLEASVFRDVWHAILDESGIAVTLVEIPSHEDRRRRFSAGRVVLDCCSIVEWRDRKEEVAVQLWSQPIFYTVDHLVLQDGRAYDLPDPSDLRAFRVAVVKGFSYQGEEAFGPKVVFATIGQMLDAVAIGKADLSIVNSQEFRRLQKVKRRPLVLGPEHNELILRARVHNSRPDLLVRINDAIKRLKENGKIALLTGQRLRQ